MAFQAFILALLTASGATLSAIAGSSSGCNLSCSEGSTCYANAVDAMNCLASVPFNNDWATATLDVLSQSLDNFGFGALYHSTGPPYSINLGVQEELASTLDMVTQNQFTNDLDFQEHVQTIFQKTLDAHTRYHKPACYNAVFVQPFAFDMRIVQADGEHTEEIPESLANEPKVFLMRNLYTDEYAKMFPSIPLDSILDKEVTLLNGVEFTTEVSQWGDTHETRSNNRGIRFNAAIRSYVYRSAQDVNVAGLSDLTLTMADGASVTLPWMASYTTGLADVDVCAATPEQQEQLNSARRGDSNSFLPHGSSSSSSK
mmetsp:Transcript_24465/g.40771  ORF Transcript_24465/g.40771 Transcript_24465/m.40771 type:complete len:315 (+) Transcript_24465:26-970(+)